MKRRIKDALDRLNLLDSVNVIRSIPRILRWLGYGCAGPAPHPVKMRIVRSYLKRFGLENFVETGTYQGETLKFIAKSGVRCISIELAPDLFAAARSRFSRHANVTLIHGDSGDVIPQLLAETRSATLFWLDGHFSAGNTASGDAHTPINEELTAILAHPRKDHVILIDDAHCFTGNDGYPHLDELLRYVRTDGTYRAEVSADIVRLVPRTHR